MKLSNSEEGRRLLVLGARQYVKVDAQDSGGGCAVIEQISPVGSAVPLHVHEREDEIFHVLAGRVSVETDGRTAIAGVGATIFLPRRIPHGFSVVGDLPARLLIVVSPAGLEGMFSELDRLPPGPPDFAKVTEICGRFGVRFVETSSRPAA